MNMEIHGLFDLLICAFRGWRWVFSASYRRSLRERWKTRPATEASFEALVMVVGVLGSVLLAAAAVVLAVWTERR